MGLVADGLVKHYARRAVVNGVRIEVNPGETVGLLGPNGAGKTTTFYMAVGLVAPDEGEVLLDGDRITRMPMHQRARQGVGYLPQENCAFRRLSVEDNIAAVLEWMPCPAEERRHPPPGGAGQGVRARIRPPGAGRRRVRRRAPPHRDRPRPGQAPRVPPSRRAVHRH